MAKTTKKETAKAKVTTDEKEEAVNAVKETDKKKNTSDEKEEAVKAVKKTVKKKEPYIGVNVRDNKGKVIGLIPSGNEVKVLESLETSNERVLVEGTTKDGKLIEGTVLKDMLE